MVCIRRSLENQQEVSITLGRQVRRAVEMFVAALDRADRESGRALLQGVAEEHVYEAALSLMMRLVFLVLRRRARPAPYNQSGLL